MQKLPMKFVPLLMICLSACQTRPDELIKNQKFVSFSYVEIDGKKYIDPDKSFCAVREYKYSLEFLGPITKFRDVKFDECNKLNGYTPKDYIDVTNFLEDVRLEIKSYD